jgi:hypothetical protein
MVPRTGIEPVRPLCRKAADFKSAVSTYFTIEAVIVTIQAIVKQKRPELSRGAMISLEILEAWAGVEPTYTDLQSGA